MTKNSITKRIAKYSLFAFVALVLIAIGQLGQALKFNNDLRMHVIAEWSKIDESKKEIAELFVTDCIRGGPEDYTNKSMEDAPFSVYECGESLGAYELVSLIRTSDSVLKPAWPLSVIE